MLAYPAQTFEEAVDLSVAASNQIHQIVNGSATEEVTVEDGSKIPTVRKAYADNFFFKSPIPWEETLSESVFNQLRSFEETGGNYSWWYAPSATVLSPVLMTSDPKTDSNWVLYAVNSVAFVEIYKRLMEESGFTYIGNFNEGCTITSATQGVLDEKTGLWYSWDGTLNKVVDPNSIPSPVEPGAWILQSSKSLREDLEVSGTTIQQISELRSDLEAAGNTVAGIASLKSDLAGDNGFSLSSMKPSTITTAIKRALEEVIYDQILNVKWFGATGNWDMGSQTGADDTAAIQATMAHYATLGSRRVGAKRAIRIPAGHYRVSALDSLTGMDFGVDFIGDGENSTYLWFDHTNTDPALTLRLEFAKFSGINFMGSLSDQNGSNSALWKQVGIKCKLDTNYADIDVKFENCGFYFWQDFVQVYGRGCVFNNCSGGFITNLMNIVASPDTVFTPGSVTNSDKTGMRHYVVRDSRFDVVSRIYKITGTGTQKDHINGILCANNEFTQCDILVDGADAIIRRSNIIGNNALYSFATGVVQVKSSVACQMISNNFAKEFDDTATPDSSGDCITSLWIATAGINGLLVYGNVVKNLRGDAVSAGSASSDVNISGNYFLGAWTFPLSANHYVFYSASNCSGLIVDGNNFQSGTISGNYYLWNTSVQTSKNSIFGRNSAPWSWVDPRVNYTPKLLVNGVQSAAVASSTYGKFRCDDTYCYVDAIIIIDPTETTGNLSISLPSTVTAVPESITISPSYGGNGLVARSSGFSSTGNVFAPIQVNPTTQEAELHKQGGMVTSRVTAADTTGAISLFVSFKYRH